MRCLLVTSHSTLQNAAQSNNSCVRQNMLDSGNVLLNNANHAAFSFNETIGVMIQSTIAVTDFG